MDKSNEFDTLLHFQGKERFLMPYESEILIPLSRFAFVDGSWSDDFIACAVYSNSALRKALEVYQDLTIVSNVLD